MSFSKTYFTVTFQTILLFRLRIGGNITQLH